MLKFGAKLLIYASIQSRTSTLPWVASVPRIQAVAATSDILSHSMGLAFRSTDIVLPALGCCLPWVDGICFAEICFAEFSAQLFESHRSERLEPTFKTDPSRSVDGAVEHPPVAQRRRAVAQS